MCMLLCDVYACVQCVCLCAVCMLVCGVYACVRCVSLCVVLMIVCGMYDLCDVCSGYDCA